MVQLRELHFFGKQARKEDCKILHQQEAANDKRKKI